ncbi:MAG: dTDP-4-dehydrorhamnose reductase [Dysgonamonadaceae bacterium]|jgi:dTDP-4-dehydrorhamnose reductase|nr:dTDP-4-dehydrorhamnose reductase [Dysgonamonadaceae bacterium]
MRKKILITGANGQLGNELQKLATVYSQLQFFPTDIDTLNICDKAEMESFFNKNKIDYIVNCAAYTAVDKAEDEIETCYKINRDAVQNLAESTQKQTRIIHISTDYVFDGTGKTPLKESDKTNPQSVYGKSKLAGEQILMKIKPESIIIRTAWLYSSFGNNFVKTMLRLGKERSELNVVYDQQGTPTYAADLAQAILSVIIRTEETGNFPAGIYHYSNEGITSWFDFTKKILQLAGITACTVHPIPASQYPAKAPRPGYSVLDKSKIRETFGIVVPEWEQSLRRCIKSILFCLKNNL